MSTKYTPGPWLCEMPDDDGSIFIIGSDLGGLVGAAHCWPTEIDTRGSDRVRANARLIAAAPELLEALRGFVDGAGEIGDPDVLLIDARTYETARALLAKIDG